VLEGSYTDQDYINLACLVDPGRELKFDTEQRPRKDTIEVTIDSFEFDDIMDAYKGKMPKRNKEATMIIYKEWLKNYLGFFEPGYYEYIMSCLEGTKVTVLPNCLASAHLHDYEMQGKVEHHHEIVPLWKGHEVQIIGKDFVKEYARVGFGGHMDKLRFYNTTAKDCNPPGGFEHVPFPRCRVDKKDKDVPQIFFQITGVRAEVKHATSRVKKSKPHNKKARYDKYTIRWLGIQNSKYVALPEAWVDKNIAPLIYEEAVRRGIACLKGERNRGGKERFAKLPPGDVRDDDPPEHLRNLELGLNYYYQGKVDNCLMGSFANAMDQMMGSSTARELLDSWSPSYFSSLDRWTKFQEIAAHAIVGSVNKMKIVNGPTVVNFKRPKKPFHLSMDDSMPIVIQLRGRDGSETHAITVFNGNIYDSASRYILKKTESTLQWCSGEYGFDRALKTFVLNMETRQKTKRKRH
jgi:hypothetical protein